MQDVAIVQDMEKKASLKTGRTGGLPYMGVGWYRTTFKTLPHKKVELLFDGAMSEAKIYVNGKEVGEWPYGYNSFHFDVTPYVNQDGKANLLAVRLENKIHSSRWYPGAGLYRNVHLIMNVKKQLIILILILLCAPSFAQNKEKLITLKFTNISLSEAMAQVEKASGYTFFYDSQQINVNQKVSLNVNNETIFKTVATLLKGINATFEIDATHIVISNEKQLSGRVHKITGTVVDENGEPVIGANVLLVGTSQGVITDLDGKYMLNAPAGSMLKISYIGYTTQIVKADQKNVVRLLANVKKLEEVVVVGYGSQRKSDLTGGVVSVDQKKINMVYHFPPLSRIDEVLLWTPRKSLVDRLLP